MTQALIEYTKFKQFKSEEVRRFQLKPKQMVRIEDLL